MRCNAFEIEKGDLYDIPGIPNFIEGFRGINIEGKWEYSTPTWEEVQELKTEFLFKSLREFSRWKTFKTLPLSGGYNEQKNTIIQIFETLESEQNGYNEWDRERKK